MELNSFSLTLELNLGSEERLGGVARREETGEGKETEKKTGKPAKAHRTWAQDSLHPAAASSQMLLLPGSPTFPLLCLLMSLKALVVGLPCPLASLVAFLRKEKVQSEHKAVTWCGGGEWPIGLG